nr:type II toxin-antitoxin system RelE/ParE family toxin [Salegentibacter tibetensis]
MEGFYSIRINKQWRIIFKWENDMLLKFKLLTIIKIVI